MCLMSRPDTLILRFSFPPSVMMPKPVLFITATAFIPLPQAAGMPAIPWEKQGELTCMDLWEEIRLIGLIREV